MNSINMQVRQYMATNNVYLMLDRILAVLEEQKIMRGLFIYDGRLTPAARKVSALELAGESCTALNIHVYPGSEQCQGRNGN